MMALTEQQHAAAWCLQCPWCPCLFGIHGLPVCTAVAAALCLGCPGTVARSWWVGTFPLPYAYFGGLAPAKQTPLGLAGLGLAPGGEGWCRPHLAPLHPFTPSAGGGGWGPSRCLAQSLTANRQAAPAPTSVCSNRG